MYGSFERIADSLSTVSGVDCRFLLLTDDPPDHEEGCAICDTALRGHPAPTSVDATHRFAAYQAERLGGRYVYICPLSLLHVAAPVIRSDVIAGLFVCGPAVLGAIDDSVGEAVQRSRTGQLISPDAVRAWLERLPRLAPDEATALSEIVMRLALSCSDAEARDYLSNADPYETDSSVTEYLPQLVTMEGDKRSAIRYPVEKESALIDLVTSGDRKGAERSLAEILDVIGDPGPSMIDEYRSRVLELVVLLSRAAIAGGADVQQVFGLEYRSLVRVREMQSTDAIKGWLSRILRRFMDLVFDLRHLRYSGHLARVLKYVHDGYRGPVSLAQAARHAGLSSGYLSRIFNSEMNTSFSAYVNAVRIQEAQRLLRRTALSVGDAGFRSGFPDPSYFTQVFRRSTGMAPTEYRDRYQDRHVPSGGPAPE